MTARLPRLQLHDLDEQQTLLYHAIAGGPRAGGAFPLTDEKGCLRGPFNAMLLSPPVGSTLQAVGAAVRYESVLTGRVRELAILVVAAYWGSDFEREAHEAVGRTCGLTEAEMTVLRRGSLPDLSDSSERVAVRTASALARDGILTEAEYVHAVKALGERGLFELTTLVGYYALLALQLRVFAGESKNANGQ
jgi:4-carboxymuconolactone decarboxylase